jgi:hypothetical protein
MSVSTLNRAEIGDGERDVIVSAMKRLNRMATSREIANACEDDERFLLFFAAVKNKPAKIRNILQRECPEAKQGFRGRHRLFIRTGAKPNVLWGLRGREYAEQQDASEQIDEPEQVSEALTLVEAE